MSNDSLFGVHGAALAVRSQRMGVLASNIANASTPGYKAKDIDFQAALASAETGGIDSAIQGATLYRVHFSLRPTATPSSSPPSRPPSPKTRSPIRPRSHS